jgi:hypothetical protein
MNYRIDTRGAYSDLLAQWLTSQGWHIHRVEQRSFFKGEIIGTHADPYSFLGQGINTGDYIHGIFEHDVADEDEVPSG